MKLELIFDLKPDEIKFYKLVIDFQHAYL